MAERHKQRGDMPCLASTFTTARDNCVDRARRRSVREVTRFLGRDPRSAPPRGCPSHALLVPVHRVVGSMSVSRAARGLGLCGGLVARSLLGGAEAARGGGRADQALLASRIASASQASTSSRLEAAPCAGFERPWRPPASIAWPAGPSARLFASQSCKDSTARIAAKTGAAGGSAATPAQAAAPHRSKRPRAVLGAGLQKWVARESAKREREKQSRVLRETQKAREGAPTPMDLRADHDGSPEWVRTGRVMEPYSLSMQDKFAVVYLKGHQYKVTVGDLMYVDQIPELDVNDRVDLTRVMLLGSRHDTIIGRPLVPGAKVTAVVEEHFLDGKRIIFKFKRRKNYKRYKGFRPSMTSLRVTDVVGIEVRASRDGAVEASQEEQSTG